MAAEKTLPMKLSGEEVRKALVDKIDQALAAHCFLNPNTSYDFFEGSVSLVVNLHDAGTTFPIILTASDMQGEMPPEVEQTSVEIDVQAQPPNAVREQSGQEIPVLAVDRATGKPTIKKIQYGRKKSA